jgi:hypothetical protein
LGFINNGFLRRLWCEFLIKIGCIESRVHRGLVRWLHLLLV